MCHDINDLFQTHSIESREGPVTMRRNSIALGLTLLLGCVFCSSAAAQPSITGVAAKMTGVAADLAKTQTGEPVQTKEKSIVHDLDELISALEKECANCRGVKRNNPTRPLADSVIRSGTGGIGNLVDPRESNKDWAKLSARERDRILQSMSEGFPPEYRLVLERYYRRLAEEKTVGSSAPKPASKPAAAATE
jgi:hypothetical protein